MKRPVHISYDVCGFEKLNNQEEAFLYNWYYEQKDKINAEPSVKKYMALASQREKIRLDCITKHGEYTVAGKEEFERRCKQELPEWNELKKDYESKYAPLEEEFNRKTLAITWKRHTAYDVLGKPLLTPEEWITEFDNSTTLQRNRMELPYVETVRPVGKEAFHADRLIVNNLQEILDLGFATSESCSGMLADHPDRRHYKDSPDGGETYKAGQPVHQTLYGCNAYVSFPKPESHWNRNLKNTQQQIDIIRRVAEENGWVAIDSDSMLQPALRLELPMTYDGSSMDEIIQEADKLGEKTIEGFNALNYPAKVAAMLPLNKQVAKQHGGIVPWTDKVIAARWNALSNGIKAAIEQQRHNEADLNRITDVRRITKKDGSVALRCKIDGEQQSMKDVTPNMLDKAKKNQMSDKELVSILFKEELYPNRSLENGQKQGMKR